MDAYKHFHLLLRRDFAPLLRLDGFKGSGSTFRRIKGDTIHVINIQGSRYGGKCCVNLGVHYFFLPTVGRAFTVDPKKLMEYDCEFRSRLHEENEPERWWNYGTNQVEAEASITNLIELYRHRAWRFFEKFEPFPDVFERITPAEIGRGDCSKLPAAMTLVRAALTMARIMNHLGRVDERRQFAEVGLKHLGGAVGLKPELDRLRGMG